MRCPAIQSMPAETEFLAWPRQVARSGPGFNVRPVHRRPHAARSVDLHLEVKHSRRSTMQTSNDDCAADTPGLFTGNIVFAGESFRIKQEQWRRQVEYSDSNPSSADASLRGGTLWRRDSSEAIADDDLSVKGGTMYVPPDEELDAQVSTLGLNTFGEFALGSGASWDGLDSRALICVASSLPPASVVAMRCACQAWRRGTGAATR